MKKIHKISLLFVTWVLFFTNVSFSQEKLDTTAIVADTSLKALPQKNNAQVDQMITFAKKFLGTPYHYSGTTPSGFDCSGFIAYIFGNFGVDLVHSSYGMAQLGKTFKLNDIKPGDLIFFKGRNVKSTQVGHVAMVVEVTPDAINFIHSSSSRGVVIDNFKTSKYYIPRYITAKRLDYGVVEDPVENKKTDNK